jgi:hypothetical protein
MPARTIPFPFPLPEGDVSAWHGGGDPEALIARDLQIVRWFIEERWGRKIDPATPLGEVMERASAANLKAPQGENLSEEDMRHALHAISHLPRLAWAVRALHGRDSVDWVDASFIDNELLGADDTGSGRRKLALGIGTLVFAGRLVQGAGGRIVSINGNSISSRGHDIQWLTPHGETVFIERKDRAYEAGLNDTPEKQVRRVLSEVVTAGPKMPQEPKAFRVLVVGFQHLVRPGEEEKFSTRYGAELNAAIADGALTGSLLDCVIVEHLGFEAKIGGLKTNFFDVHLVQRRPEFIKRVLPLLARAHGQA